MLRTMALTHLVRSLLVEENVAVPRKSSCSLSRVKTTSSKQDTFRYHLCEGLYPPWALTDLRVPGKLDSCPGKLLWKYKLFVHFLHDGFGALCC